MLKHGQAVTTLAFFAAATLAMLLAAQTQLVCTRQMVLQLPGSSMPGMSGMGDMAGMGASMPMAPGIALCPVVLVLALAAGLLAATAAVMLVRAGEAQAVRRSLVRACAGMPLGSVSGLILALGSAAVGTLIAVDGTAPAGPAGWVAVAAILVATALAIGILTQAVGRFALALARGLARSLALGRRLGRIRVRGPHRALDAGRHDLRAVCSPLAARSGLRAPPLPVR